VESLVKPIPAGIAGERPAGAVTTVRSRCQADQKQPGLRVTKPGHRPTPILLPRKLALAVPGDLAAMVAQPRATLAGVDLVGKEAQRIRQAT
jgi:hypothetical protein